ncbi:TIGR00297 family protein [Leptothoe sp. PORK10 BA2]|uniref:TIGR00297 family protein n=1 Tax=Leptothoe sp. PORK10 BA2 TaxID=3110254 RepID=UPI002B20DE22|nr:TIGR00297 family protein [Leptothoe sp. PORK10 BA2]MEA5466730.1 TIGR00297 family protein [Leptothoe sp. PORK10 BA2]
MMQNPWLVAILLNTLLLGVAFISPKKLLTPMGYLHAWVLGVIVWGCLGWQAYAVMLVYFAAGSAVTKVGLAEKEAAGIAEDRGGVRGPGNVWGSALTAAICALLVWLTGLTSAPILGLSNSQVAQLLILGFVASLSTKLSDTSATEIGKAYGQRTFLITTLQSVPRGTEGAVSLEGTLAGVVGSLMLAVAAWGVGFIPAIGIVICAIAAFIATTIESLIGATIEDKLPGFTHDVVNIVNTLIGAVVAICLGSVPMS